MLRINGYLRSSRKPAGLISQAWICIPSKLLKIISSGVINLEDLMKPSLWALNLRNGVLLPAADHTSAGRKAVPKVKAIGIEYSFGPPPVPAVEIIRLARLTVVI